MPEDFYLNIYEIVRSVPRGRVTTYGAIANALGTKRSSRLVGMAMNASHYTEIDFPAHRVVNRNGLLTGKHHFNNGRTMKELLTAEGISVIDDQVQNFSSVFWDPINEE